MIQKRDVYKYFLINRIYDLDEIFSFFSSITLLSIRQFYEEFIVELFYYLFMLGKL